MKKLEDVNDDMDLESGTVFRLYGVNRRDIMKLVADRQNEWKKARDYYDYLLFNASLIVYDRSPSNAATFVLVNVTANSTHRGDILASLISKEQYTIKAGKMKKYFEGKGLEIFVLRGSAAK